MHYTRGTGPLLAACSNPSKCSRVMQYGYPVSLNRVTEVWGCCPLGFHACKDTAALKILSTNTCAGEARLKTRRRRRRSGGLGGRSPTRAGVSPLVNNTNEEPLSVRVCEPRKGASGAHKRFRSPAKIVWRPIHPVRPPVSRGGLRSPFSMQGSPQNSPPGIHTRVTDIRVRGV